MSAIRARAEREVNMRKLILAGASVLALGIGGLGASYAAGTGSTAPNAGANMPAASSAGYSQNSMSFSRAEIRQAQQHLRDQGLYKGHMDGILGPQTKQALSQFQKNNGLSQTATLDQATMDKLLGNSGASQGSSMPPTSHQGMGPMANPQPASPPATGLGDHTAPKH